MIFHPVQTIIKELKFIILIDHKHSSSIIKNQIDLMLTIEQFHLQNTNQAAHNMWTPPTSLFYLRDYAW